MKWSGTESLYCLGLTQVAIERKLLEEAREARRREREEFISEVAAERRTLAQENADTMRQLDAARSELLQLKTRYMPHVICAWAWHWDWCSVVVSMLVQ